MWLYILALKHSGLVLDPGSDFILEDDVESHHVRISFIQKDKQTLESSLMKLKDFNKWFHSVYWSLWLYNKINSIEHVQQSWHSTSSNEDISVQLLQTELVCQ